MGTPGVVAQTGMERPQALCLNRLPPLSILAGSYPIFSISHHARRTGKNPSATQPALKQAWEGFLRFWKLLYR